MIFDKLNIGKTTVKISTFKGKELEEFNLMIVPDCNACFPGQMKGLEKGLDAFLNKWGLDTGNIFLKRFFLSDFTNQAPEFHESRLLKKGGATSVVQQTPLCGPKVVLWVNAFKFIGQTGGVDIRSNGNSAFWKRNGYRHLFVSQATHTSAIDDSEQETCSIFEQYDKTLHEHQMTLFDHCLRTWFYVRDIDNNYAGMVKKRNEFFDQKGLTKNTHFIASTGIEGRFSDPATTVIMDAYSVGGVEASQISYLKAPEYLNPTHEYGVAFERGTAVDYGDRRHIFISGTASINNKGQIVHPGDIEGQTKRVFENIRALLEEAEAGMDDIGSLIIYLRDASDYPIVKAYVEKHFSGLPAVIVLAPVCRPGWLIEAECIAIKKIDNATFHCF